VTTDGVKVQGHARDGGRAIADDEHVVLGIEVPVTEEHVNEMFEHGLRQEEVVIQIEPNTNARHGMMVRPRRGALLDSLP
jgi:hypothetical protein